MRVRVHMARRRSAALGVWQGERGSSPADLVRRVVEEALEVEGWTRPASLDVHLLRDTEMREVNATRRGVDEPTDVLSFPLLEAGSLSLWERVGVRAGVPPSDFFVLPPGTVPHLGDVLVSLDRVDAQAEELGHSRERELAYLIVHGVLHILGYDHKTAEEHRLMREREEAILARFGLSPRD